MLKIKRPNELDPGLFCYAEPDCAGRVREIIAEVRKDGDSALRRLTALYDKTDFEELRVGEEEMERAADAVDDGLKEAIACAARNLREFSEAQLGALEAFRTEVRPGVMAEQRMTPLARAGIYVPGGRHPLISSVIMAAVPARAAGVGEVVVCSPPSYNGSIHPAVLYAARLCGVDEVYRVGGAQAVAAMALGTASIKKVEKIVGPGNAYVTAAKKELFGNVGIDFIAGPTEVVIMADAGANPVYAAADLIAQAEHDIEARPILITDSRVLADAVAEKVEELLSGLGTAETARKSLEGNGLMILVDNLDEAVGLANMLAPEHLALYLEEPEPVIERLRNFGSLFIGEYSPEALGDYSAGINHILPTNKAARFTGGLNVKDFLKFQTVLRVSPGGIREIGPSAVRLARAEGLEGHALSIALRLGGTEEGR